MEMTSLFRRSVFRRVFATDKSSNTRQSMVLILPAMFVACTMCNCSPINSKSSTLNPFQRSTTLQLIGDVPSLPQNILVNNKIKDNSRDSNKNNNNKPYNHNFYTKTPSNSLHSNATNTKFLNKFSIIKRRLTRQTPTLNVDGTVFCETDHDCKESSSGNAQPTIANDTHNHTRNRPPLVCINGACGQQDNANNNITVDNVNGTEFGLNNPFTPSDVSSERLRMLPIMIVLGLMFVGICVAMNLFSRARFKNQRSGIFANPRVLKVATAQSAQNGAKRRRSKVSSRRSRTELLARAQQMSEQLQKQHQLQMEQQHQTIPEVEENGELELSIEKLSATPTGTNQLTTYVQVESSHPSDACDEQLSSAANNVTHVDDTQAPVSN